MRSILILNVALNVRSLSIYTLVVGSVSNVRDEAVRNVYARRCQHETGITPADIVRDVQMNAKWITKCAPRPLKKPMASSILLKSASGWPLNRTECALYKPLQ